MSRWHAWTFHSLSAIVSLTGVVYFWMKHLLETDDPFALVNHPLQPAMLNVHILAAPLLVFVLGLIYGSHIAAKLSKAGENKRSGLMALFSFLPMVFSGYLLQVASTPWLRQMALVLHLVTGAVFALTYLVHQIITVRLWRSSRRKAAGVDAAPQRTCAKIPGPVALSAQVESPGGNGVVRAGTVVVIALLFFPPPGPALAAAGRDLAPSALVRVERQVYLMGTRAGLVAYAPEREQGIRQLETFIEVIEQAEQELSTWRDESALSRLNRQPLDVPFPLGAGLCGLFADLFHWNRETGSLFDPAIGSLIDVWGVHAAGRLPHQKALAQARELAGMRHLDFDRASCRIVRRREVTVDSGAFGKGEALDRVLEAAARKTGFGPWMIDLGGQIMVQGHPPGGLAWPVDLAHPVERNRPLRTVRLPSGSLSTSGGSERDLEVSGHRVGHILDPRSGRPVQFRGSVAVWHSSALVADVLSTALYVMGPEAGLAWAEARDLAGCFFVAGSTAALQSRQSKRAHAEREPAASRSEILIRSTAAFSRRFF